MNKKEANAQCERLASHFPEQEFYVRDFADVKIFSKCKGSFISAHHNGHTLMLMSFLDIEKYLKENTD